MKNNFIAVYLDSCVDTQLCNQVSNNKSGRLASFRESGGEQAEVGRTRLFPLALRGKADLRIPAVYFPPAISCMERIIVY